MINKTVVLALISLVVFLTACDNQKQSDSVQAVYAYEKVENVSWLREKLPAQTLAYFRIPTFWELFLEDKADVLQPLQKLEVYKSQLSEIKKGFVTTYSELMPKEAQLPFKTFLTSMTTPLEIAIINASDGSMVPNGLIATTLKDTSFKDLDALFSLIAQQSGSQFKILQAFDGGSEAKFMAAMMPVFVLFDDKTGKLALLTGITASVKQLHALLATKQHAKELDKIFAFENSVDQAGKNIEFWLNIQAIFKQNQGMIPASEMPMIEKIGIDKIEYFWAGTSSTQGKSALIIQLGMPDVGIRQFFPRVDSHLDVQTAGVPRSVWQIAFPSVEQIKQAFEFANSFNPKPQELKKTVADKIEQIDEYLGVSLEDIFNVYGQKMLIVTDDAGTWFASKILDHQAHNKILDQLSQALKAKASVKQLAGVNINESIFTMKPLEKIMYGKDITTDSVLDMLPFYQHSYYQIEGDYILQAFTPQVLADRSNSKNKQALNTWLVGQQNQDWDHSIFAHSQEIRDAPRDIYHTYLNILAMLGNFANVDVDLFALPTAQQLLLPKTGRYGFSLDSSNQALTMKISYEYAIIENMSFMDSYFSVAFVGVLMAYAIPAYRDYTVRSKIITKMYQADDYKIAIAEYYYTNQALPNSEFISGQTNLSDDFLYNPKNGEITIYYTAQDDSGLAGKSLKLTPNTDAEDYIQWDCSSENILQVQLPTGCYRN